MKNCIYFETHRKGTRGKDGLVRYLGDEEKDHPLHPPFPSSLPKVQQQQMAAKLPSKDGYWALESWVRHKL